MILREIISVTFSSAISSQRYRRTGRAEIVEEGVGEVIICLWFGANYSIGPDDIILPNEGFDACIQARRANGHHCRFEQPLGRPLAGPPVAGVPHDAPLAPYRRQGDPAQESESDLLPDQRRGP